MALFVSSNHSALQTGVLLVERPNMIALDVYPGLRGDSGYTEMHLYFLSYKTIEVCTSLRISK